MKNSLFFLLSYLIHKTILKLILMFTANKFFNLATDIYELILTYFTFYNIYIYKIILLIILNFSCQFFIPFNV